MRALAGRAPARAAAATKSAPARSATLLMSSAALRRRCASLSSSPLLLERRRAPTAWPPRAAAPAAEATTTTTATTTPTSTAAAAVQSFYDAYNRRDLPKLESLLSEDVVYSDLVYPAPKKGREAVMAWLERVSEGAPRDLAFVIEGLAAGEEQVGGGGEDAGNNIVGVGVKWHVALLDGQKKEKKGSGGNNDASSAASEPIIFPFSRGCSYVEVDAKTGLIVRVRDVVEPSSKPGDLALSLLGGLAPLIRAVGPTAAERAGTVVDRRADGKQQQTTAITPAPSPPSSTSTTPLQPKALALWLFYAGYLAFAMLSDLPPGPPAYATQPEVLLETLHESVNLLWIAETLSKLGLPMLVPVVPSHPVSEATFNFAVTWAALFVPLMFTDARGSKVKRNDLWALAVVFVTNLFLTPWMALREGVVLSSEASSSSGAGSSPPAPGLQKLPGYSRALGFFAAGAGALCVGWALAGRPELGGDLAARWEYLSSYAGGDNRVFWAFILDFALFSVWQASMLAGAPAAYRFLPFAGMAAWLIVRGGGGEEGKEEEKRA